MIPFRTIPRRAGIAALLCLSAVPGLSTHAAIYTVGSDAACTHVTLQAAVNSANATPAADEIRVTRSATYTAHHTNITTNQTLLVTGGYAACDAGPDALMTTLSGAGGAEAEVLRIDVATGGHVQLRRLMIRDGDNNDADGGGGIAFTGDGVLEIDNSAIAFNTAGNGGGIYARGTGTNTELVLGENVFINNNTARYNGGGLYVQGLEMTMTAQGSMILRNEATGMFYNGALRDGFGGGIYFNADNLSTYAMLGSSGGGTLGSIYSNTARHGGGIAMNASDDNTGRGVFVKMFSTDPLRLNGIVGNFAHERGGAVYMQPYELGGGPTDTDFAAWSVRISDNAAPAGAAAYLDSDSFLLVENAALFRVNSGDGRPAEAVPCSTGVYCADIGGNIASDINANPTPGDVFQYTEDGGQVWLAYSHVHGNRGRRLFGSDGGGSGSIDPLYLRSSLIEGNTTTHELIRVADAETDIADTTIAGNTIGAAEVMKLHDLAIRGSILWQPGKTSLSQTGSLTVGYMIASEVQSLGDGPEAIVAEPRFVDPEIGDYSLRAASHAVDFTASVPGEDRDMIGNLRDVDLPIKTDQFGGPRDFGALERQDTLPILLNGNFDNTRQWTLLHPGATYDAGENHVGPSGSRALRIAAQDTPVVVGAVQCVHLPGPGTYALNGWGRGTVSGINTRDSLALGWQLRFDGDEACDVGAPDATGVLGLTSGTTWAQAPQDAIIEVPAHAWTHETSLLVTLRIADNGVTILGDVNGYFDGITLEVAGVGEELFSDGFEGEF